MPKLRRSSHDYFMGIDPGKSGGISCVGLNVHCHEMPHSDLDLMDLLWQWAEYDVIALLEEVHSMPRQGVKAMFSFGVSFGKIMMALTAAQIPFQLVKPQQWQKHFTSSRKKGVDRKRHLRIVAQRLFPREPVWSETKTHQMKVCDSLLIAEYCRKTNGGLPDA